MQKIFRVLKRHFPFLWRLVENVNGFLVRVLMDGKVRILTRSVESASQPGYSFRKMGPGDIDAFSAFFESISEDDKTYFRPFPFSADSYRSILSNPGFVVFEAHAGEGPVAVFFLRLFANNQAFLGFLVKQEMRGRGIGKRIIEALAAACRLSGIALLSSVSRRNIASWKAHQENGFHGIKELGDENVLLRCGSMK
jgi:GNAT superfamily N-acetyltransferase